VRFRLARAGASVIWPPVAEMIVAHPGMQAPVPRRPDVRGPHFRRAASANSTSS